MNTAAYMHFSVLIDTKMRRLPQCAVFSESTLYPIMQFHFGVKSEPEVIIKRDLIRIRMSKVIYFLEIGLKMQE